jgi:hypothetical protein
MTAPARRWCDRHQRYECSSLRRYMSTYCHNLPIRDTGACHAHTARLPATTARELAHQQVSIAIREGELVRPDACELCPSRRGDWPSWVIHAHHEDYARPLDVIWLCAPCHHRVHAIHGGLPAYLAWLRQQLAGAERLIASRAVSA